jgi:hypothetical protein
MQRIRTARGARARKSSRLTAVCFHSVSTAYVALTCVTLAAAVACSPLASASVHYSYTSDQLYSCEITHMTDLDQRRAAGPGVLGLAGDGSMYCVPTASMNLLIYAANHGFPGLPPGPGYWQSQSLYNAATLNLAVMGALMGTDPATGTGGDGWLAGMQSWLGAYNGLLTVTENYASGMYSPRLTTLAKSAMNGSIVSLCYGRYEQVGSYAGLPLISRTGGHCVTLAKATRSGATQTIWYRDPADDTADYYSQSAFCSRTFPIADHGYAACASPTCVRVMSAFDQDFSDGLFRIIDSYVSLKPKFGLSYSNQDPLYPLLIFRPIVLSGSSAAGLQQIPNPSGMPIVDLAVDPDLADLIVLEESASGPPTLTRVDTVSGAGQTITDIPDARRMTFGRNRQLYVLAGRSVLCLDLERADPVVTSAASGFVMDNLTYDDATDQVVVLAVSARKLLRFPADLVAEPEIITVPSEVPMDGDGSVIINPVDHKTWFVTDGSASLFGIEVSPTGGVTAEPISLPAIQSPTGIEADDAGHLFVSDGGQLIELALDTAGRWEVVSDSAFAGFEVGPSVHITRSRTNFDPTTMSGPEWYNLPAEQLVLGTRVPDATGDMNCDGALNGYDIDPFVLALTDPRAYAAAYPDCNYMAGDINDDGAVNGYDIDPFITLLTGG